MNRYIHSKLLLVLAALTLALAAPAGDYFVFFGTYTNALSQGIYVSRLDAATGKLSAPELAAQTPSPCFLAVSPDIPSPAGAGEGGRRPDEGRPGKTVQKYLYAANSVSGFHGEKTGAVSAFALDQKTGRLTLLNQTSSGGAGPCHLSTDGAGKTLLVANYGSGSVESLQLEGNGSLGVDVSHLQLHGSSVNPARQAAPHAHFIQADPSHGFALACDLGTDHVMVYRLNSTTSTLSEHASAAVPPGSGPRHLAFSLDGKFVHVINEMGCTVTTFAWDAAAGALAPVETVSALPPGVIAQPNYTAAEILTAGKYVYVTIRGHDSVSVFAADAQTGRLAFLQNLPCGGKVPRGLGIDLTGRWLLVGNQGTDNVAEFSIDPQSGKLAPAGRELKIGSPVDVKFVKAF
jgi:6-phosphogluconolactonase